jgi:hypothetical protein
MSKDQSRDADPEVVKDLLARSREPGGKVYAVAWALLAPLVQRSHCVMSNRETAIVENSPEGTTVGIAIGGGVLRAGGHVWTVQATAAMA